jgi:hypothetical protein
MDETSGRKKVDVGNLAEEVRRIAVERGHKSAESFGVAVKCVAIS